MIADSSSGFSQKLKLLGVVADQNPDVGDIGSYKTLLIDGSKILPGRDVNVIAEFVENGGTALIHGAMANQSDHFKKWFGAETKGSTPLLSNWRARALRIGKSPILDGLSSQDFYWRRPSGAKNASSVFHDPCLNIEPITEWLWDIPFAEPQLFPGAILLFKQGKGKWIIDNIRWDTAGKELEQKTNRIACQLLINCGVELNIDKSFIQD